MKRGDRVFFIQGSDGDMTLGEIVHVDGDILWVRSVETYNGVKKAKGRGWKVHKSFCQLATEDGMSVPYTFVKRVISTANLPTRADAIDNQFRDAVSLIRGLGMPQIADWIETNREIEKLEEEYSSWSFVSKTPEIPASVKYNNTIASNIAAKPKTTSRNGKTKAKTTPKRTRKVK
jgi:hypothetical protein